MALGFPCRARPKDEEGRTNPALSKRKSGADEIIPTEAAKSYVTFWRDQRIGLWAGTVFFRDPGICEHQDGVGGLKEDYVDGNLFAGGGIYSCVGFWCVGFSKTSAGH